MEPQEVAKQLRKPEGENGIKVGKGMNQTNAFIYKLTLDNLDIKDNSKVLELGFGNGFYAQKVLDKANKVEYHGLDFSETMFNEASILNKSLIEKKLVHLNLGDISLIPYPDNFFDVVFTINTLYFWEDPLHNLNEIKRVLKKDGLVCISIRPKDSLEKLPFSKFGFKFYTIENVIELYNTVNLKFLKYDKKADPKVEISYRSNNIDTESACVIARRQD